VDELDGDKRKRDHARIAVSIDPTGVATVAVSGDVDIANADALKATVVSVVADAPERLVFDLSDLRFIDSAGIAVLLHATEYDTAVELLNPSPAVRRVVELTGLTAVLKIK
jgi:anti-sigma B factor antagonist